MVGMAAGIEEQGAGLVVPPNDPAAIAAALRSLEEGMGRRARRLVEERYTWERAADGYEALFESLTGSSSK
jgi:glycosyltransferase involved in cell wall biosynthesis